MQPPEAPLSDDFLDRFLGGVSSDAFGMMFGIDHGALIRGADILLKGGGELGNSLFAAALGGTDPASLLDEFDAEAEALFKPRGQNQAINKAVSEYSEARKKIVEYSVPTMNWAIQDKTLSKARQNREGFQRQIDERAKERNRLERIQRLWQPVSKRHALLAQLESSVDVILLPADFSDRRKAAINSLSTARSTKEEAAVELERLHQDKASIHVPAAILESSDLINSLNQRFGSHRKANQDLEKLNGNRQQIQADRETLFMELPADVQDNAKQQRMAVDLRTRLQTLGTREDVYEMSKRVLASLGVSLRKYALMLSQLASKRSFGAGSSSASSKYISALTMCW
jgi:uncharacterized protein YhaN